MSQNNKVSFSYGQHLHKHENKIFDYTKLTNKHFTNPIQTSPTPHLPQRYL